MKKIFIALACTAFLVLSDFGQASGCNETDYVCRLGRELRALQDEPNNPEHLYEVGRIYQGMGDHARAVNSFTMYVSAKGLKPEYLSDGYNNRGVSQRALKKLDLAVADYTKAIELNPKNPRAYVNRANAQLDLGKADEALADWSRAISIDPKFALSYSNRGNYFSSVGKMDDALADLGKAIELDPTNPEPFYTRAFVYRSRKEFSKMIPDLDRYIAIGPGNPQYLADGYLNRGIAYGEIDQTERAIADMTKAIETAPRYADAYGARAVMYRRLKKNDLAEADEKKFAELRP